MSAVQVPSHAELTICRPNGDIETVRFTGGPELNPALFARIQTATKAAGRGDVLSYTNVKKIVETPAEWDRLADAEREYDAHQAKVYGAMDHYAEGGK